MRKRLLAMMLAVGMVLTILPASAFATEDGGRPSARDWFSSNRQQQEQTGEQGGEEYTSDPAPSMYSEMVQSAPISQSDKPIEGMFLSNNESNSVYFSLDDEGTVIIYGKGSIKTDLPLGYYDMSDENYDDNGNYTGMPGYGSPFSGNDNIKNIFIDNGITDIPEGLFENCTNLTTVTMADSITYIGDHAFKKCINLTAITIAESVTYIGDHAFEDCYRLGTVNFSNNVTSIGAYAFANCSTSNLIVDHGDGTGSYSGFTSELLTSIVIPDSVTSIGEHAFDGCDELRNVTLPKHLTSIADYMFKGCDSLTQITIPNGVTKIGSYAFYECPIANFTIPNQVTTIGDYAFSECTFENIMLPNSVTSIGTGAFARCENLTNIEIPNSVTSIGAETFMLCTKLTSVTISNKVDTIESHTFSECIALTNIFIPTSVKSIKYGAFVGCETLSNVYYGGDETQWKAISFPEMEPGMPNNAKIHFDSTRIGSSNNEQTLNGSVEYLYKWDKADRRVYFGSNRGIGYFVDNSVAASDFNSIDQFVDKYVLVKINPKQATTITAIHPVESKIGTCSAVGADMMTIDGIDYSYPTNNSLVLDLYTGKEVLYHLSEGNIVGASILDSKTGTLEAWDSASGQATIDGIVYSTNFLSSIANIEQMVQKKVTYKACNAYGFNLLLGATANVTQNNSPSLNITQDKLQEKFINDHINYYRTSYSTDIVRMSSIDGTGLGFVLQDIDNDWGNKLYQGLTVVNKDLSMFDVGSYVDINWTNGQKISFKIPNIYELGSSEYSAVLFQLLANDEAYDGIIDTFSTTYAKNIRDYSKLIADNALKLAKNANTEEFTTANAALQKAAETIRTAEPNSTEFAAAYVDFETLANDFLDANKTKVFLKDLCSIEGDAFAFIGAMLDEINIISKQYQYACWAESYAKTRGMFGDVLRSVAAQADIQARTSGSNIDYIKSGALDEIYGKSAMCYGLSNAIKSFLSTMDKYTEDANSTFANKLIEGTGDSCMNLAVSFLSGFAREQLGGSICPEILAIRKVLSTGKFMIDLFTDADDEYKYALTVTSLDTIASLLVDVSKMYGEALTSEKILNLSSESVLSRTDINKKQRFSIALHFDESIKMYKNAILLACEYGKIYEEMKLVNAGKQSLLLRGVTDFVYSIGSTTPWQKQASESSVALAVIESQKQLADKISCHDEELKYNSATKRIEYTGKLKIINIACPVDVSVMASDGTEIAFLTNGSSRVSTGYEAYFYNTPLDVATGDYIKTIIVPATSNYQILINGTDSGKMNVSIGSYDGKTVVQEESFTNVPVTNTTRGQLYLNGVNAHSQLDLDGKKYGGNTSNTPKNDFSSTNHTSKNSSHRTSSITSRPRSETKKVEKSTSNVSVSDDWSNPFADIDEKAWYYPAVRYVGENNLMTGAENSYTFSPNTNLSRAMLAQILYNKEGKPAVTKGSGFGDVPTGAWYEDAVTWASEKGIVSGYEDGRFAPNDPVTREQLVVMLWRYFDSPSAEGLLAFTDVGAIRGYAQEAMTWAVREQIISGYEDYSLRPADTANRVQVAQILKSCME